jgi:5'-methylthioadenosine phosphorylase
MTNMPEAKLAREAEMCYATVAMVTDFDCWHPDHDHVTVEQVIKVAIANADKGRALVKATAPRVRSYAAPCRCGCQRALDSAIMTNPAVRDPAMIEKLSAVAGRVVGAAS